MKRNHTNSHGLVRPCLANPTFKHKNESHNSISNNSQILNYFIKNDGGSNEIKEKNVDFYSPYKSILSEPTPILNDSLQDENDFKSSKSLINPKTKSSKPHIGKPQNKKSKCRKSNLKKGIQKKLTNMINENFSNTDTNPEHLQMALALSNSEQLDDNIEINFPSTQIKIINTRKALEKFGFKSKKQFRKTAEVIKKPKKSRYQYITPTLYLRTEEDRQNLISSKISMILSQNLLPAYCYEKAHPEIKSQYLSDLACKNACIFNFSNINNKLDMSLFYVKDLQLEKSNIRCGHLLKDWTKIPGREKSPERKIVESILKNLLSTNTCTKDVVGASQINIESFPSNNISVPKYSNENVVLDRFTLIDRNRERTSEISNCINTNKKNAQDNEQVEVINVHNIVVPRAVSPDLFGSEEEDIIEINTNIEEKLQSSLQMISNIKCFNISQSTLEQQRSNTDMLASVQDDKNNEVDLKHTKLNCETNAISKIHFSNTSKNQYDEVTKSINLSESILAQTGNNTDVLISVEDNKSNEEDLKYPELNSETSATSKMDFSNTSEHQYNEMSKLINLNRSSLRVSDLNVIEGKGDETITRLEITENTRNLLPEVDMQKNNGRNDSININEVINTSMNSSFDETLKPEIKLNLANSVHENINQTDEYSNSQLDLNSTDDILTTLEINLTRNISTPKNKKMNLHSASLLSNFESLDESDKEQVHEISSDNSDCYITHENLSGIQHFESFYDEPCKTKNTNFPERNPEYNLYISHADRKAVKNGNDKFGYKNDTNSINCVLEQNSSISLKDSLANTAYNHFEQTDMQMECKDTEKSTIQIEATKSEFEYRKKPYEILSDSDNTCIYEFENDNEWQNIYKNSSIRKLLEKSLINPVSLQFDNTETVSANKEIPSRKSLSFTSLPSKDYKLDISKGFKRHASFTTPSPNKNIAFGNICMKEFKKYTSSSSISSENYNEDSVICISDEELNYSSMHSTPYGKSKNTRTNIKVGLNSSNIEEENTSNKSINVLREDENNVCSYSYLEKYYDDFQYNINENQTDPEENLKEDTQSPLTHPRVLELSNKKSHTFKKVLENNEGFLRNKTNTPISEKADNTITPDGHVIVKTTNITPMPDYDNMNTPTVLKELQKVGVKQLKRHRAVQILKHIYETTHPVADNYEIAEDEVDDKHIIKRRKVMECTSRRKLEMGSNNIGSIEKNAKLKFCEHSTLEIVGDIPESDDLIFERKQSKKISGCPVPLHIAFHNLVSSNRQLKQNILLYEPLQLEVLYAMLKEQGFKYHIQDLLTFLDKKCITVRTNQNVGQKRGY